MPYTDEKKLEIESSSDDEKQITKKHNKDQTIFFDESKQYSEEIQGNQYLASGDKTMTSKAVPEIFTQEEGPVDELDFKKTGDQLHEPQSQNITGKYTYLLYIVYFIHPIQCYQ